MENQYKLLNLVVVDRGRINVGTPSEGRHIPYCAGLVVLNTKTNKKEYLDEFNSEQLLRVYFGYCNTSDPNPSLSQIVSDNRLFIDHNLVLTRVHELSVYLGGLSIEVAPRNAERMRLMAERMSSTSSR